MHTDYHHVITILTGIAGGSASGKTTLAKMIINSLGECMAHVYSQQHTYLSFCRYT